MDGSTNHIYASKPPVAASARFRGGSDQRGRVGFPVDNPNPQPEPDNSSADKYYRERVAEPAVRSVGPRITPVNGEHVINMPAVTDCRDEVLAIINRLRAGGSVKVAGASPTQRMTVTQWLQTNCQRSVITAAQYQRVSFVEPAPTTVVVETPQPVDALMGKPAMPPITIEKLEPDLSETQMREMVYGQSTAAVAATPAKGPTPTVPAAGPVIEDIVDFD